MNGTLNKVMIIGNLGDNVKMHHFDDSNCVGRFPLATSESYTNKDTNERVTQTDWHNIVARNKLAEICEKYLNKGDKVYIEGRLKTRKWDDNGVTKYSTEVFADSIEFLTPKKGEATENSNSSGLTEKRNAEDLPF